MKKLILPVLFMVSVGYASAQATKPAAVAKAASSAATLSAAPAENKELKAEFVNRLFSEQSYLNAQIVDKLFVFKFSPTCWAAFTDPANTGNESGFGSMRYWVRYVVDYAKHEKLGDLMELAVDDKKVEKENRPMIDEMIQKIHDKFSLTVEAPVECRGKAYEMMMRFPYEVLNRIGPGGPEWAPTGGEAHFTVTLSPVAKDMAVKISSDGKRFAITGPAYTEAYDTKGKIENGLERANKNR